jgi:hypothetical protein
MGEGRPEAAPLGGAKLAYGAKRTIGGRWAEAAAGGWMGGARWAPVAECGGRQAEAGAGCGPAGAGVSSGRREKPAAGSLMAPWPRKQSFTC